MRTSTECPAYRWDVHPDSLLIARDRMTAYIFMNAANAALVLGGVAFLLPRGLTAGAVGWALGQGLSLLLGLLVVAIGKPGRHHLIRQFGDCWRNCPAATPSGGTSGVPSAGGIESRIGDLLAAWPLMPTTLIGEAVEWDQSPHALLEKVTGCAFFTTGLPDALRRSRTKPGAVAQCGFWFPPIELPVGWGVEKGAAVARTNDNFRSLEVALGRPDTFLAVKRRQ